MSARSSAAIVTAATVTGSGLNFAATALWTRLLDPGAFGRYALVSAGAVLLNATLFEWLRLVSARTLYDPAQPSAVNPARANALIALYAAVALLFVAAVALISGLGVGVAGVTVRWWPVMAAFTLTEMALAFLQTVYRLRQRAWPYFWNATARSAAALLLGFVLVRFMGLGALGTLLGIVVAQGAVALTSVVLDPLWRAARPWRASRAQLAAAVQLGYPLIASCALTYAASFADRFLIGATLGAHAVGLYAAPVDLLQKTLVFMMMTVNLTGYPALVRAYEDRGPVAACATLETNLQLQLGLGLPAVVGLMVLAPGIVQLLLGPAFRAEGARLLPLVGTAALLRCLVTFHLMMAFQVTRRMGWMVVPPLTALVTAIPAGLIGIRLAGLPGMALAALIAQLICYTISANLAKRVLPLRLITPEITRIAAAALGMGLVLSPFSGVTDLLATAALILVGSTVYGALLLALGVPAATRLAAGVTRWVRRRPA
ncbi:oligosaccharide flippase family protein [Sphingomonas sp. BK580]|uniref:lipopolysaccharide biosynthesis protein n=1 Tax=Sphingomonas sp. BK580 TaxID=2586972 RepID=UPI00161D4C34|nr:oligosaccharide flippase family protein [Sphingomonas sp. BK580]MBB3694673.1 O-antigen/teichoic acid export membrane protein [Sphingomonas sp. BK580]